METTIYTTIGYVNYNIEINVFSISKNKTRLVYTKNIARVDLGSVVSEHDSNKIINQIKLAFEQCQNFKIPTEKVFLILDNVEFYTEKQKIKYDFEMEKVLDINDIARVYELSQKNAQSKEEFTFVDSKIKSILLNENTIVKNPLNRRATDITLCNEVVFVDFHIYTKLKNFVTAATQNIVKPLIVPIEMTESIELENGEGIIQLSLNQMSFTININEEITRFNIKVGFKKLIEDLYERLETKEVENAQELTFLMKNYFPLRKYEMQHSIYDAMEMDDLIDTMQKIILEYFDFMFMELKRKDINVTKFRIIFDEFDEQELVDFLNDNFEIEFAPLTKKFSEFSNIQKKCAMTISNFDIKKHILEGDDYEQASNTRSI